MKLLQRSKFTLVVAVAALAFAGCEESGEQPQNLGPAQTQEPVNSPESADADNSDSTDTEEAAEEDGDSGDNSREFDSGDDAIIQIIEQTFKTDNAVATWKDGVLHIALDGNAESPSAYIPCSAAEMVLADGEEVILQYPDGEFVCAERPNR